MTTSSKYKIFLNPHRELYQVEIDQLQRIVKEFNIPDTVIDRFGFTEYLKSEDTYHSHTCFGDSSDLLGLVVVPNPNTKDPSWRLKALTITDYAQMLSDLPV